MSQKKPPDHIRATAVQVRRQDFLWSVAIAAGVLVTVAVSGLASTWWLPIAAWLAFVVALFMRYRFSTGRAWFLPVERAIEAELGTQKTELQSLRSIRGVAQALPEPLFILDQNGLIEHANPAAEEFINSTELSHRHLTSVLRAPSVFEAAKGVAAGEAAHSVDFEISGTIKRYCRAFVAPLDADGGRVQRVLIYIHDLSAERRVDRMRTDFIASASHELRTPLASLLGFIETIRGHARDDVDAQERFLVIMQSQAERMQRLVNDLMSLSRIELHENVPPTGAVDICGLIRDQIDAMVPVTEKYNGTVTFHSDCGQELCVEGDHDQLTQAIQNLIDNALKYGGQNPHVAVDVGIGTSKAFSGADINSVGDSLSQLAARRNMHDDDFAFVRVRDHGDGVPRTALPRLTERFYRVSVENSRKAGGTGLGLAIVKHIMNRHQGGFLLESVDGEGAAFSCYLPRALQKIGPDGSTAEQTMPTDSTATTRAMSADRL